MLNLFIKKLKNKVSKRYLYYNIKMSDNVKLIFMDGECEYDNHVIIFFETLKNHIEDFGCSVEIDLRGIEIEKEEFNSVLNMCEMFVKNNKIDYVRNSPRQQRICDYLGIFLKCNAYICEVPIYCAGMGQLDILKYAHKKGCCFRDETICCVATENGRLECLKYIHENGYKLSDHLCSVATEYGQLECLKYLHKNGCKLNNKYLILALCGGYLEVLKYLHENGCELHNDMCCVAANRGSLECLKYLYDNGCEVNNDTCLVATERGRIDILKYIHDLGYRMPSDICTIAATYGQFNVLKYLHEYGYELDNNICSNASAYRRMDILHHMHVTTRQDRCLEIIATKKTYFECLKYAYKNGCHSNKRLRKILGISRD